MNNNIKPVCLLAINRAEMPINDACDRYERDFGRPVKRLLLVNESYTHTDEYFGDETNGGFEIIILDFADTQKLTDFINNLQQQYEIIPHCRYEPCIQDYSKIIPLLNTPYVQSPKSLRLATVKSDMREAFLDSYPEITPKFVKITNSTEYDQETFKDFTFPVIVKPTGLNSSWLVNKCDTINSLITILSDSFKKIKEIQKKFYGVGEEAFIVEEFLVGKMYTIDAYVLADGEIIYLPPTRVVTSNEMGKDGFYCYRSLTEISLTDEEIREGNICVERAVLSVGIRNSTVHAELYLTQNGWKVIEIGPRIGGGKHFLYKEAYGIDHYYNDMLLHCGKKPNVDKKISRYASGFCMYPDKEGIIKSIEGIDDALKLNSTRRIYVAVRPGEKAIFASNGGRYVLDGNLSNDSSSELNKDFDSIINTIKINTA